MPGQLWSTNTAGNFMYADQLSDLLRTELQPACKFRQLCDAKDGSMAGPGGGPLHAGENYHWNVYSDVADQGTVLEETSTMPETSFTISQGTLTVSEYGQSVPYTGVLDDLSLHPVEEIIRKALKNDARKAFDIAAHAQMAAAAFVAQPVDGTDSTAVVFYTNGTATETVSQSMSKAHVKLIIDQMKERNIEPFSVDDYMAVGRPSAFRGLKDDVESVFQYVDQGHNKIMWGETGRYESTRFVEQTNITDSWASANAHDVFFMGADTVAECVVIPEEIRGKIPSDYGRSRGVSWYALEGFGLVHTVDDPDQARICRWTSAA